MGVEVIDCDYCAGGYSMYVGGGEERWLGGSVEEGWW